MGIQSQSNEIHNTFKHDSFFGISHHVPLRKDEHKLGFYHTQIVIKKLTSLYHAYLQKQENTVASTQTSKLKTVVIFLHLFNQRLQLANTG